jgi:hypothetical protein
MIECPNCKNNVVLIDGKCPKCGCSISDTYIESAKQKENAASKTNPTAILYVLCTIFVITACVFFWKAYDVKHNYYNSEYSSTLNKNAYVGGDAYNIIINGTYFAGYSVIASSCIVCGMVSFSTGLLLAKKKEE